MNAPARIETATRMVRARVSHTDAHLTLSVSDEDAHLFPHRYEISMARGQGKRVLRIAPVQGKGRVRGVRPGKAVIKLNESWRRLQFRPLVGLPQFGVLEVELEMGLAGRAKATLPEELPAHASNSGWMKRERQAYQKDLNPIPEVALPEADTAPAPVASERMTIAQAAKVVNAFLADTPGAELEIVKEALLPDRIRICIVEVFE